MARPLRAAAAGWERFWFDPISVAPLALLRIAYGLLALLWTISLAPDLIAFFSRDGIVPVRPPGDAVWTAFDWMGSDTGVAVIYGALLVGSLALCLGFLTRLAALIVFIGMVSFSRRDPWVFNAGDTLMRVLAAYLVLAPSGAALSLDALRRGRDAVWSFPLRSPWVLRLMQIQLSAIYLAAVWGKLQGTTWNDGTAVSYSMRIGDIGRFLPPDWLTHSVTISALMTYGTVAVELSIGFLVWNRKLRPYVLGAGAFLHLGIDLAIRVGFFSFAMLTLYIAFLAPERAEQVAGFARERLGRRRGTRAAAKEAQGAKGTTGAKGATPGGAAEPDPVPPGGAPAEVAGA